jgi:hypothetical protein
MLTHLDLSYNIIEELLRETFAGMRNVDSFLQVFLSKLSMQMGMNVF